MALSEHPVIAQVPIRFTERAARFRAKGQIQPCLGSARPATRGCCPTSKPRRNDARLSVLEPGRAGRLAVRSVQADPLMVQFQHSRPPRGGHFCEFWNQRTTSKYRFLVEFWI